MDPKTIRVKIFGIEYPLRGEDEDLIRRAAQYVDSLMTQFHEKSPDKTTSVLAVLTALNLAEELMKLKNDHHGAIEEVTDQINLLSEKYRTILNSV